MDRLPNHQTLVIMTPELAASLRSQWNGDGKATPRPPHQPKGGAGATHRIQKVVAASKELIKGIFERSVTGPKPVIAKGRAGTQWVTKLEFSYGGIHKVRTPLGARGGCPKVYESVLGGGEGLAKSVHTFNALISMLLNFHIAKTKPLPWNPEVKNVDLAN